MSISQRDVVEVPFNLPQGIINHPVIVLSNDDAIQREDSFIGVMMTSQNFDDEYSFVLSSEMLNKPFPKKQIHCEVRLHLIGYFQSIHVIKNSNYNTQIKKTYFDQIIKQINELVF